MDIQTLVYQAKQKTTREKAHEALFMLLNGQMMAFCRKYIKDESEAVLIMHDGFLSFFGELEYFEYRSDSETVSLLKTITRNLCINYIKKKENNKKLYKQALQFISGDEYTDPEVQKKYDELDICNIIGKLSGQLKLVFNMFEMEDQEHPEIARRLNISEKTSYSQLSRARLFLKNIIKNKIEQDENYPIQKTEG